MTAATAGRPVSVEELQRAWRAVLTGQFRTPGRGAAGPALTAGTPTWRPAPAEAVLPVVRCPGTYGASTLALALASAADGAARVVECGSPASSGLASASTAELGRHRSGWTRGTRGEVLIERTSEPVPGPAGVPRPSVPGRDIGLTVLDVGWELGQVLTSACWLGAQLHTARAVAVVTCATIPGLRQLENALTLLDPVPAVAAVLGPSRRKWPKPLQRACGPLTGALDSAGRLVTIPHDPRLAVTGVDTSPLPAHLLAAAHAVLALAIPDRRETS